MNMENAAAHPTALVTGAAHRIGREIALALARRGYDIGLHYHHAEVEAQATAADISALGRTAVLLPADLASEIEVRAMFERLDAITHNLRVLVNCAAVMPAGNLRDLTVESWDATMDLNLRAPFLCSQLAARRMGTGGLIVRYY